MFRTSISLAGFIIAGAVFFAYTQPEYDKTKVTQAQIASYDEALKKAADLQTLKAQLMEKYQSFDPVQLARLQKLLPDHVDNIRLILDMDSIATRRGMTLSNVDISGNDGAGSSGSGTLGALGASTQKYDSLSISFSIAGTYSDIKAFLDDLQSSLRIVDVTAFTISSGGSGSFVVPNGSGEPTLTLGLHLKTYWLK